MLLRRVLEFLGDTALHHGEPPVTITVGTRSFFAIRDELTRWRSPERWAPPPVDAMELTFEHVTVIRDPARDQE